MKEPLSRERSTDDTRRQRKASVQPTAHTGWPGPDTPSDLLPAPFRTAAPLPQPTVSTCGAPVNTLDSEREWTLHAAGSLGYQPDQCGRDSLGRTPGPSRGTAWPAPSILPRLSCNKPSLCEQSSQRALPEPPPPATSPATVLGIAPILQLLSSLLHCNIVLMSRELKHQSYKVNMFYIQRKTDRIKIKEGDLPGMFIENNLDFK